MSGFIVKIKIAFSRKELEPFSVPLSTSGEIISIIKEKLFDCGFAEIKEDAFCTLDGIRIDKNNLLANIKDGVLSVLYNNVIPPYGAYEYERKDGVVFYFHTAEAPHRNFPHIHAWHSGETISIYLSDYRTVGHFSNRKKEKSAVAYVKENSADILQKWNEIIKR